MVKLFKDIIEEGRKQAQYISPYSCHPSKDRDLFILCMNASSSHHADKIGDFPVPSNYQLIQRYQIGSVRVGYLLQNAESSLLVFTGTGTDYQAEQDFKAKLISIHPSIRNTDSGDKAHQGMVEMYLQVASQLRASPIRGRFWITGFSLGGAMACLAGLDLLNFHPEVVAFGAPNVFSISTAKSYNQKIPTCRRVNNAEDVVPNLPPGFMGYGKVGRNINFTVPMSDSVKNHIHAYKSYFGVSSS